MLIIVSAPKGSGQLESFDPTRPEGSLRILTTRDPHEYILHILHMIILLREITKPLTTTDIFEKFF